MSPVIRLLPCVLLFAAGCADVEAPDGCHYHGDELHCDDDDNHGLATKLILSFTPSGGGDALTFEWSDPEADGDPVVDDIVLPDASATPDHVAQEYSLDIQVWNELEDPVEDVTVEIRDEAEGHQFFFTGSGVRGPATGDNASAVVEHAYADTDDGGLPVGLSNTMTTLALGTGELDIVLRHLPRENGEAVKESGLAETVAADGFGAIGGNNDIEVSFDLTVE